MRRSSTASRNAIDCGCAFRVYLPAARAAQLRQSPRTGRNAAHTPAHRTVCQAGCIREARVGLVRKKRLGRRRLDREDRLRGRQVGRDLRRFAPQMWAAPAQLVLLECAAVVPRSQGLVPNFAGTESLLWPTPAWPVFGADTGLVRQTCALCAAWHGMQSGSSEVLA